VARQSSRCFLSLGMELAHLVLLQGKHLVGSSSLACPWLARILIRSASPSHLNLADRTKGTTLGVISDSPTELPLQSIGTRRALACGISLNVYLLSRITKLVFTTSAVTSRLMCRPPPTHIKGQSPRPWKTIPRTSSHTHTAKLTCLLPELL
jgi:hypothetical protein